MGVKLSTNFGRGIKIFHFSHFRGSIREVEPKICGWAHNTKGFPRAAHSITTTASLSATDSYLCMTSSSNMQTEYYFELTLWGRSVNSTTVRLSARSPVDAAPLHEALCQRGKWSPASTTNTATASRQAVTNLLSYKLTSMVLSESTSWTLC